MARRTAAPLGATLEDLDLTHLFRSGSKAHKVALALLSGGTVRRREIATELEVAPSSVSRVVAALEGAGVQINHSEDPDTREAMYRVVNLPRSAALPASAAEFKAFPGSEVEVKLERTGEFTVDGGTVHLTSKLGKVSGHAPMHAMVAELGRGLPLMRVILDVGGTQTWVLGRSDQPLHVTEITYL